MVFIKMEHKNNKYLKNVGIQTFGWRVAASQQIQRA